MSLDFLKKMDKNKILIGVAIVGILVTGVLIYAKSNPGFSMPSLFGPSVKSIADKAVAYINDNGLSSTPASLVSTSEANGLVKIKIKIGSQEFDSYATKDGKLFFPQAFDISGKKDAKKATADNSNQATPQTIEEATKNITKSSSPMLEAYVVARCPFGLQMQRAMDEAVKGISSLAQYIKVRYIGSVSSDGKSITAMHGDAEAKENLRQICIREEQPAKYWNYVACQMKAANTENSCATSTGVDTAKLDACVATPSRGVAYAKKDFDLQDKFSVSGSPTMILNEKDTSETPFGGRSADAIRAMVCAAFDKAPSFCTQKLSTDQAATSFSATYSSGSSGSASSAGGCGAAQ